MIAKIQVVVLIGMFWLYKVYCTLLLLLPKSLDPLQLRWWCYLFPGINLRKTSLALAVGITCNLCWRCSFLIVPTCKFTNVHTRHTYYHLPLPTATSTGGVYTLPKGIYYNVHTYVVCILCGSGVLLYIIYSLIIEIVHRFYFSHCIRNGHNIYNW